MANETYTDLEDEAKMNSSSNYRSLLEKWVITWAVNKGINNPVNQTLKTLSETGELADAIAKGSDGSMFEEGKTRDDIIDAIGDIEVCLIILKYQLGLSQNTPLSEAWRVISKRTGKTINGTFIKNS